MSFIQCSICRLSGGNYIRDSSNYTKDKKLCQNEEIKSILCALNNPVLESTLLWVACDILKVDVS